MKGIILAAGKGTRLYPMTRPVCKPLLPVYDKPLIYYSVSVLIQAGIRDILVIVPPGEEHVFQALLGDGSQWGISITYAVQLVPRGIADAMLVGAEFVGQDSVCLVLGDNIFYQEGFAAVLKQASDGTLVMGICGGYQMFGKYYVAADGTLEKLDAVTDAENGTLTAELSRFGTLVIAEEGVGVKTGVSFLWWILLIVLAVAVCVYVYARRKKHARQAN